MRSELYAERSPICVTITDQINSSTDLFFFCILKITNQHVDKCHSMVCIICLLVVREGRRAMMIRQSGTGCTPQESCSTTINDELLLDVMGNASVTSTLRICTCDAARSGTVLLSD
jgi:hypothetical protein